MKYEKETSVAKGTGYLSRYTNTDRGSMHKCVGGLVVLLIVGPEWQLTLEELGKP